MTLTTGQLIPPGPAMFHYELVARYGVGTHPVAPPSSDLAADYDVSIQTICRWLSVLESVGYLLRGPQTAPGLPRAITINAEPTITQRAKPCRKCQIRIAVGKWCPGCRQSMRSDRVWRKEALRLASEGLNEMQIYLKVSKQWPNVRLYDRVGDEDSKGGQGVISVLRDAGLSSGDWVDGAARQAGRDVKYGITGE